MVDWNWSPQSSHSRSAREPRRGRSKAWVKGEQDSSECSAKGGFGVRQEAVAPLDSPSRRLLGIGHRLVVGLIG